MVQHNSRGGNGLVRRGSEYPLTDAQGTTKLETNSNQGVTGTQETEAFGRSIGGTGSTSSPYGYHGAEGYRNDGDGPAGLEPYQKVGARYYDATYGRFITRDTDLSQSPYAYCNGDPVNCTDPSGHDTQDNQDPNKPDPNDPDYERLSGPNPSDPGGNPNPQVPPAAGSVSVPDGSGGTVTVSPSGGGTISDTQGHQTISLSGLGGPTQTATSSTSVSLGSGFTATGTNSVNLGTGAGSSSVGLGYSGGGFSAGFSINSGGLFNATFGYKGFFP